MNQERFDELTRALATSEVSRGRVLKTLAASALLGMFSSFAGESAEAKRKRGKRKKKTPQCPSGTTFCNNPNSHLKGQCVSSSICTGDLVYDSVLCECDCFLGFKACGSNKCCSQYQVCCGGRQCVYTKTDEYNCGSCGTVCAGGSTCQSGQCQCPSGKIDCIGSCIDPVTDPNNCGGCAGSGGKECTGGRWCQSGQCQCLSGKTYCNGQCVDTETDASNCGSCGNVCTGKTCQSGTCACPSGKTQVGGVCVCPNGGGTLLGPQTETHRTCTSDPEYLCGQRQMYGGPGNVYCCADGGFRCCTDAQGAYCCPSDQKCNPTTGGCDPC